MVVKGGNYRVVKSGENLVKGLCGPQHTTDILTKSSILTNIY